MIKYVLRIALTWFKFYLWFFWQKFLKVEDDAEEEKLRLQDKLESLESIVRLFEIKVKNAQDQS